MKEMSRTLLAALCVAVALSCGTRVGADTWTHVYGGVDDPKLSANGWSSSGSSSEAPQWALDTEEGNGHKALKVWHKQSITDSSPYYYRNLPTGHMALIWQMRFRIIGGQAQPGWPGNVTLPYPYYERCRYYDGRSTLYRVSDVPPGSSGTGDDFVDVDMPSDGGQWIAASDNNWHTYTVIQVTNQTGVNNPGSKAYLDGVLTGVRSAGLTGNSYDIRFGIVSAPKPPTLFADSELWIDYVAYGFDDTPDNDGNYGWDIADLPPLDPDTSVLGTALINPSFDDGTYNAWTKFGTFDGARASGTNGITAHGGGYWAGSASLGVAPGGRNNGGIYQQVLTTPGKWYQAKVWIYTRRQGNYDSGTGTCSPTNALDAACRIGADPTGGTAWSGVNVAWCPWTESDHSQSCEDGFGGPWKQIQIIFKASSTVSTIFLQQRQAATLQYNITAFDDATFAALPAEIPEPKLGDARKLDPGYPVRIVSKVVTAAWPWDRRFCIQETDGSAGLRVKVSDMAMVPAVGQLVTIDGQIQQDNTATPIIPGAPYFTNEMYLSATSVTPGATANPAPKPVGMGSASVGGGAVGAQPGVTDGGTGLATTGLLCTIWGRVVEDPITVGQAEYAGQSGDPSSPDYDPYDRYHFYVDDGRAVLADYIYQCTGTDPYSGDCIQYTANASHRGVKVYYQPYGYQPQVGDWVACTGIAGTEMSSSLWKAADGSWRSGATWVNLRTLETQDVSYIPDTPEPPYRYTDIMVWR